MLDGLLRERAASRPAPPDWIYLHDFAPRGRPISVSLASGRGTAFAADMASFVDEAQARVARAFDSEDYERRRKELGGELERRRDEILAELRDFARERDLLLELTPAGLLTVPVVGGKPVPPAEVPKLSEPTRKRFAEHRAEIEERMPAVMNRMRALEREGSESGRELDREVGMFAVGHLLDELVERYADVPELGSWLDRVREDVIDNLDQFRHPDGPGATLPEPLAAGMRQAREQFFGRYEPNVLVTHEDGDGAPVVLESNPTYYNLFGRVEYEAMFGALTTSHTMIKPGALHRANGGYLILQAQDVLVQPFVWGKLKETLRTGSIEIENIGTQLTLLPTRSVEPEPIAVDVKVVLIGPPRLHTLLFLLDEDMRKLFKVKADFDVEMARGEEEPARYAAFIARQVAEDDLPHFDSEAVARVVEHGSRVVEHQAKLSVRFIDIADLVAEASHWAQRDGSDLVRGAHVERAIEERTLRSNLIEEKVRELIVEGSLLIDTEGERVGQMNGLSVASLGDYAFGRPVRVTATVGVGGGDVVNVDRESELSGPIHDKGFLIVAGFLEERFGRERPLSLKASIVFEQSYQEVEGDSASGAELLALLSTLAGVPIRQTIAMTGSVSQHGDVQAIGAVNEKVEGFFHVCRETGAADGQGVIVPRANADNLMLKPEVVEAARAGTFSVWAVSTIDEAVALATGLPAGERGPDGTYPEGTVYRMVEDRLAELAEIGRRFRDRDPEA